MSAWETVHDQPQHRVFQAFPEEPESPALTRTAFYSPDGRTAVMRIAVAESDAWGELTLEHDYERDERGPPTWHVLAHEDDPLGELIADGDVMEWCLRGALAPGQRAWVRLRISYTDGTYEYPYDIDRIVDAEIVSVEPMEPTDAAERWEAFLWRRSNLGV